MIFRSISGPKLEGEAPMKVANKWNWVLEALGVSVLLESINMTFTQKKLTFEGPFLMKTG